MLSKYSNLLRFGNEFARFKLRRLIRRESIQKDPKAQKIAAEIRKEGIALLPGYFSENKVKTLKEDVDRVIEKHRGGKYLWMDPYGADHRVFGAEAESEAIYGFFSDPFLQSVGEHYFGGKLLNSNTLAAKIEAKEKNIGSGQGWYRDGNFFQFKALVYLSDVTEKNGPFQILKRSHRLSSIFRDNLKAKIDPMNTRIDDQIAEKFIQENPQCLFSVCASAGSVALVDTSAIHRGMPIQEGVRHSLFNYYYPSFENASERRKQFNAVGT